MFVYVVIAAARHIKNRKKAGRLLQQVFKLSLDGAFRIEKSSESKTARQAAESIKTTRAFRSTCVSPERNYGGVKPTPRLDQIQLYGKSTTNTAKTQQSHFATFLYALMRIDAFRATMVELL